MFGLLRSGYLSIPNTCKTPCVRGLGWGRSTVSLASVRCNCDLSSVGQRGAFLRNVSANSLPFLLQEVYVWLASLMLSKRTQHMQNTMCTGAATAAATATGTATAVAAVCARALYQMLST